MKIQIFGILSTCVLMLACQTKNRKDETFSGGASQEVAGADSKAGTNNENGNNANNNNNTNKSSTVLFRLTGGDETSSNEAKATYECEDGHKEEMTLSLNDDGESQVAAYTGSSGCMITLSSFVVGGNSYTPKAGDEFSSYDVGEMGTFANANAMYSVMVVAQLPGEEVHYQYSTVADEEVIDDDTGGDDPNQTPSQK